MPQFNNLIFNPVPRQRQTHYIFILCQLMPTHEETNQRVSSIAIMVTLLPLNCLKLEKHPLENLKILKMH